MMAASIDLRRLTPADVSLYREIRLEALADSPDAFASTFEIEQDRPLDWFAARLADAVVLGTFDGPHLTGMSGFYVQSGPKHAHKGILWACMCGRNIGRRVSAGCWSKRSSITHATRSNFCS